MIRSHDQRVIPLSIRRGTNARELASFKLSGLYFCADNRIGPLHDPVTWYKITYTGEQVAQWDKTNKTKAGALFWKSHYATCSPVYVILYRLPGSCKVPIGPH